LASQELRADGSPLSVIARLFCFGVPVERRLVASAFGAISLSDLEDLGLAEIADALVRPLCMIRPANGLLVTSDVPSSHPEIVLGAVPASETLARLTIRRPASRAFDLGTGCGVQALLLAQHASEVTAVDINTRALAFATFNAALNGLNNVDVREGSWFGPVEAERFDTIDLKTSEIHFLKLRNNGADLFLKNGSSFLTANVEVSTDGVAFNYDEGSSD